MQIRARMLLAKFKRVGYTHAFAPALQHTQFWLGVDAVTKTCRPDPMTKLNLNKRLRTLVETCSILALTYIDTYIYVVGIEYCLFSSKKKN